VEHLIEGSRIHVLKHGERLLGVSAEGIRPDHLDLPTVLFGARPIFGRSDRSEDAARDVRRCASCQCTVAYFDAVLEDDQLAGYACPHCGASPIPAWIEQRMRPGRWSHSGFLGEKESLQEVIARDDQTLARLGVSHAQIAGALDRLLASAFAASEDRLAQASARAQAEMIASGMRGVAGLAMLPLGASLDKLEDQLRTEGSLPAERGTAVDDHDVFLQVYVGYQYCPFTLLRLPWGDDAPARRPLRRRTANITFTTEPLDRELPCRPELSYRHANLEFLIVHRDTRQSLRGSGLLVHLIRDHRFFEGEHSPFRLDPEQAARVLGLT
jgi:hypothetical protein